MSQGVLTTAGAGLLHTLRVMGKEAAYEVRPRKTEDLAPALGRGAHSTRCSQDTEEQGRGGGHNIFILLRRDPSALS